MTNPHRTFPVAGLAVLLLAGGLLAGCAPAAHPGSLPPTLTMDESSGLPIAMQNGIAVPTFEQQPRRHLSLDGTWRVRRMPLSDELSLTDRSASLDGIVSDADGRQLPDFDDADWQEIEVPGTLNQPPDGEAIGGWYRRDFYVPWTWTDIAATLKIGSANYVADVWVNGRHIGYHEGGYTPFAFDVTDALVAGARNTIAVRVDNPQWGTRNDIVPWGLADWWNYGGITGRVWIEATPPTHLVRADVVPHLDGIDVSVVVQRAASGESGAETPSAEDSGSATPSAQPSATAPEELQVAVYSAEVTQDNLLDPLASALVPQGARPQVSDSLPLAGLSPGEAARIDTAFLLGGIDPWSPAHPALYVLHVTIPDGSGGVSDELWTSFGIRHVAVKPGTGQLLLNGDPHMFIGVGLHDEVIDPEGQDEQASAHPVLSGEELIAQLDHARGVKADLIRAGHTPANPLLLMLADRLGFAVWEEIPLYHYTPLTYGIAMGRGVPQQMLREMDLRDMNHPSVLFHGLSNESTGTDEREAALRALHDIDREIDGTRLTGQAAYGSTPDDPTQSPLDVAGFTFYYDVFYGADAAQGTADALELARRTNPGKPIMALEYGRWADGPLGEVRQSQILEATYPVFERRSATRGGTVGAAVWWTLEDFTTMVPGIGVEHFGLFRPDGTPRAAATSATRLFTAAAGEGAEQRITSDVGRAEVVRGGSGPDLRLFGYLAYGIGLSLALLGGLTVVLLHRGGRASPSNGRWAGRP